MTEIKYKYIYDVFGMQIGVIPISVDEIDSKKVIDEIEKSIDNEIEKSIDNEIEKSIDNEIEKSIDSNKNKKIRKKHENSGNN